MNNFRFLAIELINIAEEIYFNALDNAKGTINDCITLGFHSLSCGVKYVIVIHINNSRGKDKRNTCLFCN